MRQIIICNCRCRACDSKPLCTVVRFSLQVSIDLAKLANRTHCTEHGGWYCTLDACSGAFQTQSAPAFYNVYMQTTQLFETQLISDH